MDSDSSCYYETTYSEDERYETYVKEKKAREKKEAEERELQRKKDFENCYSKLCDDVNSVFNLPGIKIIKFTSQKIKFSFKPYLVARLVCERNTFYISLKYRNNSWRLRRDSIPLNYKQKVYNLFYTNGWFRFTDASILYGIREIWSVLKRWAIQEHQFRSNKLQRLRNGEDVFFDRDDEDLFLSDSEIEELHRMRDEIWQRMLPPNAKQSRRRRRNVKAS